MTTPAEGTAVDENSDLKAHPNETDALATNLVQFVLPGANL
jgi:hypothetical protein